MIDEIACYFKSMNVNDLNAMPITFNFGGIQMAHFGIYDTQFFDLRRVLIILKIFQFHIGHHIIKLGAVIVSQNTKAYIDGAENEKREIKRKVCKLGKRTDL